VNLTKQVLFSVKNERTRQNALWGKQRHSLGKWLSILGEEFGEVAEAMQPLMGLTTTKETDANDLEKELIQLAAVAVEIAEQLREEKYHLIRTRLMSDEMSNM
jgi:NTP pyrophosphatase (non-canonical NTP hydrolase)